MSITKKIIKNVIPIPKIESFDSFLFIGPHPDDIEIGAGATIAKLSSMGKRIAFLICTDGRFGMENALPETTEEQMSDVRKRESLEAAEYLGVNNMYFLNLCDGGFYTDEELEKGILKAISDFNPDVVFAPDSLSRSECHIDHLRVGEAAKKMTYISLHERIVKKKLGKTQEKNCHVKAIAFYMTARCNRYVKTGGFLTKQLEAIRLHKSQYPSDCKDLKSLELYLKLRAYEFGFKHFTSTAEGFRVLGTTHMHCLPEAGE